MGRRLVARSLRPSRSPPLAPEVAERVVALTLTDPPAHAIILSFDEKSQI